MSESLHLTGKDATGSLMTVLVASKQSVDEAVFIMEAAIDLAIVNGWVGLASELADVRDLLQYGIEIPIPSNLTDAIQS